MGDWVESLYDGRHGLVQNITEQHRGSPKEPFIVYFATVSWSDGLRSDEHLEYLKRIRNHILELPSQRLRDARQIKNFLLNSMSAESLRSLLAEIEPKECLLDDLVFKSPEELAINSHNFLNRAWRGIFAELPIDYRPQYNTRHTFISLCLEAGVQVTQVAAWVGNSPKTIWQHYAGLVRQQDVPKFD